MIREDPARMVASKCGPLIMTYTQLEWAPLAVHGSSFKYLL